MKKYIIFILITLFSNTLVAKSDINQLLGITAKKEIEKKIIVSDRKKRYIEPKKSTSKDSQIERLLKYTKVKKTSQKEMAYGLKMGYKISENVSVSVDVLAQVDIRNSKIKSKEANLQFALSL
ncbi:hypothetical protein MNB_SV-12-2052 [hydrothermal vent metagenome]|uniref:Uncharacterized protein n=1 Tax=hydrothermal vent metagenome TaxID=652676 RepID=A0A1W1CDL2_9ZZZZ